MPRPSPRQLAQEGAIEGDILAYKATPDEWQPGSGLPANVSYSLNINPETLATQGNDPKHVVANDYAALEFKAGMTRYGVWSAYWQRNPAADVTLRVKFFLKATGSGTIVRIGVKIKSFATGQDTSGAFAEEVVDPVTITTTTIGEIFEGTLTLTAANFAESDATALSIGRDAAEEIAGGSADDFSNVIQIIAIRAEVP